MNALILVDHGSKVEEANRLLEKVAETIRSSPDCRFDIVEACHMEIAEPDISRAFEKCVKSGADRIVVHPYFLVPGRHSKTDIPRMAREAASKYPDISFTVTEPLGLHENIVKVVLEKSHSCL